LRMRGIPVESETMETIWKRYSSEPFPSGLRAILVPVEDLPSNGKPEAGAIMTYIADITGGDGELGGEAPYIFIAYTGSQVPKNLDGDLAFAYKHLVPKLMSLWERSRH